jgi:beta-glucanase (GH16 family)
MDRKVWWPIGPSQRAVPPSHRRVAITIAALMLAAGILTAVPLTVMALGTAKGASSGHPGSTSNSAYAPGPAGWTTVFSDSFSGPAGSRVDPKWVYDIGTHYNGSGCPANWGTGEVESATRSTANVSEDGHGHLLIRPVKSGLRWTSGRIETAASTFAAPAGGEMEVIASIKQPSPPDGAGYWPAFWMLGAGFRASGAGTSGTMACPKWPSVGEIDILEDVNALSQHSGTLHCGIDPGGPCHEPDGLTSGLQPCPDCQAGYDTYSVIINRTRASDESITWYLNGRAYHIVTETQVGAGTWKAAVDHGSFLILGLALGGGSPDGVCGCTTPTASTSPGAAMRVGYVAVYVHRT